MRTNVGGNPGSLQIIEPGRPYRLGLPDRTRHVHLDISVENQRDTNCSVDISVASATVTNG